MASNPSLLTTPRWTTLLNKKQPYPLKTGGAANGVGRIEKAKA